MQILTTSEFVIAAALFISAIGMLQMYTKDKNSRVLAWCSLLCICWNVVDALSYICVGNEYSYDFRYAINFLAYTVGGLNYIAFANYCYSIISEKN